MKKVQHEENMKSERNSETRKECITEKVQHTQTDYGPSVNGL